MQIKKYSFGFDVFDFTARIYSEKNIDNKKRSMVKVLTERSFRIVS